MTESNSYRITTLADICHEAVQRFGDDWARVQAYVTERIALMPGDEQKKLTDDIGRLLAFRSPSRPSVLH